MNRNSNSKDNKMLRFLSMIILMIFLCIMTIFSYPLLELSLIFLNFKKIKGTEIIPNIIGFVVSSSIPLSLVASLYFTGKYTNELRKDL